MSKIAYNKLVRDKIPEVIRQRGVDCSTHIAGHAEYVIALKQKLVEEALELAETNEAHDTMEELADVFEVAQALIKAEKFDTNEITELQEKKRKERGGFEKQIILEETRETKEANE